MHTELKKIQSLESAPKVVKNLFSAEEIGQFLKLYEELPIAVNNLKQKVIKMMARRIWKRFGVII